MPRRSLPRAVLNILLEATELMPRQLRYSPIRESSLHRRGSQASPIPDSNPAERVTG